MAGESGSPRQTDEETVLLRPNRTIRSRAARALFGACAFASAVLAAPVVAQQPAPAALEGDFADPFVIPFAGRYYAYSTNMVEQRLNVPVAFSTDLRTWNMVADSTHRSGLRDAMPELPAWSERGATWAPEVMQIGDRYVLYYTARHRRRGQQCVGAAVSADPRGPFVPQGDEPLVCQHDLGGTIDASPFRDADGQLYLYYKNDGNHPSAQTATQLWGQRLAADGLSLVGEPVSLARNDVGWEAHVIEAPFMVRRPSGTYILFFSANDFAWQDRQPLSEYASGYASCTGPLGPCTDAPENPILASRRDPDCLSGPGHPMVFQAEGQEYIAFHGWATRRGCRRMANARFMYIAALSWNGDVPVIGGTIAAPPSGRDQ